MIPSKIFFDTSNVESVIADVVSLSPSSVVVVKSTIPVGFTRIMSEKRPGLSLLFSPEFLREGKVLYDNLYLSRIIVGDTKEAAHAFAGALIEGAVKKDMPVLLMDCKDAEAVKLFSNTSLRLG